jgi:hypothetical protein
MLCGLVGSDRTARAAVPASRRKGRGEAGVIGLCYGDWNAGGSRMKVKVFRCVRYSALSNRRLSGSELRWATREKIEAEGFGPPLSTDEGIEVDASDVVDGWWVDKTAKDKES